MRKSVLSVLTVAVVATLVGWAAVPPPHHERMGRPTGTPTEMVQTYESLADGILAMKKAEWNMVHSILAVTYGHAEAAYQKALMQIEAGQDAGKDLELLAGYVSQMGNEGDAAVAAVRKRLLEGGHHHNAKGEQQGMFDEGFVIVTRQAKKAFLDAAGEIGRMASSPDAAALKSAWAKVNEQFAVLAKEAQS